MSFYSMKNRRKSGFTLLELLVSSSISTVLVVGLGSSIYVASQTFDTHDPDAADVVDSQIILSQIMREAQSATSISELTPNAATFTVPDRDGDSIDETIRYAWSGTPGDPLTYQLNSGSVINVAEDVQQFNLTYLSRYIPAAETDDAVVLFISAEGGTDPPSKDEQQYIDQIEAWGNVVNVVPQTISQDEFTKYDDESDVIYVSGKVSASLMGTKVAQAKSGVVCASYEMTTQLGFCNNTVYSTSYKEIDIVDNSHYITQEFKLDKLRILDSEWRLNAINPSSSAADAEPLGNSFGGYYMLICLPEGSTDYNGRDVQNRRVMLPWGDIPGFEELREDALTITQRSIEWAAEPSILASESVKSAESAEASSWFSRWVE